MLGGGGLLPSVVAVVVGLVTLVVVTLVVAALVGVVTATALGRVGARRVLSAVVDREIDRAASRREAAPVGGSLEEHYAWALDNLHRMRSLIALLVKDGARLPHLDRIQTVLAEGGVKTDALDLSERMARGEIPVRDADAVAAVVLFAVVGHHLAERFFGGTLGVDRDRFAAALASLVSS